MIRFIGLATVLILFLVFSIPLLVFEEILKRFHPEIQKRQSIATVRLMFRLLLKISGTQVTVEGRENIPTDQAVLYVGNHRSYFDILIGYTTTQGLLGFVAKKEMLRYPSLKTWMQHVQCLFLDREDIREGLKTILTGIEMMKEGTSIWIFPEGTRNENEVFTDLLPFKEGSLKIAEKSGCAIIPVAMVGNADIFENHIPFIRPQKVRIRYGKPIDLKGLPKEVKKKSGAYVRDVIITMLNEMQGETKDEQSGLTGDPGSAGSD